MRIQQTVWGNNQALFAYSTYRPARIFILLDELFYKMEMEVLMEGPPHKLHLLAGGETVRLVRGLLGYVFGLWVSHVPQFGVLSSPLKQLRGVLPQKVLVVRCELVANLFCIFPLCSQLVY